MGVDGAGRSESAIQLAAREADYRHAPLIAVMAYRAERTFGAPAGRGPARAPAKTRRRRRLNPGICAR